MVLEHEAQVIPPMLMEASNLVASSAFLVGVSTSTTVGFSYEVCSSFSSIGLVSGVDGDVAGFLLLVRCFSVDQVLLGSGLRAISA